VKKTILHIVLVLLFLAWGSNQASSQTIGAYDTVRVYAYISPEGDTVPMSYLPNVEVYTRLNDRWKKYWADWTRLRNAVYVTYPYAKAAGRIMNDINARLVNVTDRAKRRQIIHAREKELKKEFTDKLTQLSIYQGKVLMKLIYRETGNNCYEIIDDYKGFINAAFWQTIAILFGSNLKQKYDPKGTDADMEKIVIDVEKMYGYRS
jgi:Domain of unknown function (DUF4294)